MGSPGIVDLPVEQDCRHVLHRRSSLGDFNDNEMRSFEVPGLVSGQDDTTTSMREESLLLAWLIVLLRNSEGGQIEFEWAYEDRDSSLQKPNNMSISMERVMAGLSSTLRSTAAAIRRYIPTDGLAQPPIISLPRSLVLSDKYLSRRPDEKDETLLHVEVRLLDGCIQIHPLWHAANLLPKAVSRYITTFVDIFKLCISCPDASIQDCLLPTSRDLDEIWSYGHLLPPSYDFCMNEMVSKQAHMFPDKEAILSWDGRLTFAEIDRYSTYVAQSLKAAGVQLHDVLPVCFEKSRWTVVAVLAVMKVGATFALMDPTLPLARLQNMAEQVGAKMMLSSRLQHNLSMEILPQGNNIIVEADTFLQCPETQDMPVLPIVPSSVLMYIIFTSGSTGTPKGVKVSHGAYTSSAIPRAKAVGYTTNSRVLDFASYAFDVSIDSMLLTVGNGGCLCIPSDEDRLNDINSVIRDMRINYAGLTPSVARILDADVISSLDGLGLGGEATSARDAAVWGQDTRIIIGYGPCECTIACTINGDAATDRDYITIGSGNGSVMWIVDPNDHDVLLPVGAVGELLVEGPIVGQGYLNDPEKTAAAFIEDPPWLTAGHNTFAGRRGRLYKTGDLGKYDPDGSGDIVFVGRKDTQVKLRGQRVELGEIESQLKARLPSETNVIAEVIVPTGPSGQPMLVVFIAAQSTKGYTQTELTTIRLPNELQEKLSNVNTELAKVVPRYMVPTAYIPVNHIPVLISGKTDRKRLRQFGVSVDLRELDQTTTKKAARELSDLEERLQQCWAKILNLDSGVIGPDDNFFALGGDSLMAMKLVSLGRDHGLDLTVVNSFNHPTLTAMASVLKETDLEATLETPAFSMITRSVEDACLEAAQACGSSPHSIEDIYACTPTQESLFTFSLKATKAYVAQRVACIPSDTNLEAWQNAWEQVVIATPILRTRLAQLQEPGLQQVVLKDSIRWTHSTNLKQYLEADRGEKMELGQSLARYAIIDNDTNGKQYMVWTVHHVLYDGWSEPIVLQKVSDRMYNRPLEAETQMKNFVKWVQSTDDVSMQDFWQQELAGATGPQFPRLPSRDYLPTPTGMTERQITLQPTAGSPFTMATFIRGAWALVASQFTGNDDVVFGETLTGRDIALTGVENIVGPLIATVPVRLRISRSSTISEFLQSVQQGTLKRTPYQHMGMQNIRKVSRDAQHACEAGTGLVIQPEPDYVGSELGFVAGDVVLEALHFNPYPLMLACGIRKDGFRVCASFDSDLLDIAQMDRMLTQLETTCMRLMEMSSNDRTVDQLSCLPGSELDKIWEQNSISPLYLDATSQTLRASASTKSGSIYPPVMCHWVCDPRNPAILSPIGCVGELWLESAFFSDGHIESPPWLLAGSPTYAGRPGNVRSTGDLVQLNDDGSIRFIGRKNTLASNAGHAVDTRELEGHISKYLPPQTRAIAAFTQRSSDNIKQDLNQELVLVIEQNHSEEFYVQIVPTSHNVTVSTSDQTTLEMEICAAISVSLAIALKKFDKFAQDSLPSYLVPSSYVVVDKLPTETNAIDHSRLFELARSIPPLLLSQLRKGLAKAWTQSLKQTKLTKSEDILRSSWAKILRLKPEQIEVDDNFFRLGGDSVLAMKLVSNLRAQGHGLTVADVFQHMRLGDAAKALKIDKASSNVKPSPRQPFSILGVLGKESFLSRVIRPQLTNPQWSIQDTYPVTDSQMLDVRATIDQPRTSLQYTVLHFDSSIDRARLTRACGDLVRTHDILRTVFVEHDATLLQVVLKDLEVPLVAYHADGDLEQSIVHLCETDIKTPSGLGAPFFKPFMVEGNDGKFSLVIRISHAQYDGMSLPRLLQDLETLYTGGDVQDYQPFSCYIAQIRDEVAQIKACNYWRDLLSGSKLSVLDGNLVKPGDRGLFSSKPVDISQRPAEITTANLLTAAWALVLSRRLQTSDVTFGSVTSGRNVDLADVENVMGPCYQFTPVRIAFGVNWTGIELLRYVQSQSATSSTHDFLGFAKISKQCTQWSPDAEFFDSVVHHQEAAEDFDFMAFAGSQCRVDVQKPHGDAPYPLKAVTFVRAGQTHVGVVGSDSNPAFVDTILNELATAVQSLTNSAETTLLPDGLQRRDSSQPGWD